MRRRPPTPSHVFIHAGALANRHQGGPHDALPSLTSWQDAIDGDEQRKRAEAALVATQPADSAEEEVGFAADLPRDVVAEGFVSLSGDVVRSDALGPMPLASQPARRPRS